jgi:hypothetical protein
VLNSDERRINRSIAQKLYALKAKRRKQIKKKEAAVQLSLKRKQEIHRNKMIANLIRGCFK